MAEYDDKMWPRDRAGHVRNTVVDRVNQNGTSERLNPHSTVGDSNIRHGDTLHILPESTAGNVNPLIRDGGFGTGSFANCDLCQESSWV